MNVKGRDEEGIIGGSRIGIGHQAVYLAPPCKGGKGSLDAFAVDRYEIPERSCRDGDCGRLGADAMRGGGWGGHRHRSLFVLALLCFINIPPGYPSPANLLILRDGTCRHTFLQSTYRRCW